jgi:ribonuclease Y
MFLILGGDTILGGFFLKLVIIVISLLAGIWLQRLRDKKKVDSARNRAEKIMNEASKEAENIKKEALLQAKDKIYQERAEFEKETKLRKIELQNQERRLSQKEENLDKKVDILDAKELDVTKREKVLKQKEAENSQLEKKYRAAVDEWKVKLESIAGLTSAEARKRLIASIEDEAKAEAASYIKKIEDSAKEEAETKSKQILALAIQKYAGDYVAEYTVAVVALPNDDMKGRIIGREGRNIRTLESVTGVDFIVDDTPEAVILSAFNPIRREIAKISLERLIADGRIHPARIEEIVKKVEIEIENQIKEEGDKAIFDLGIHGMHPELVKLIGRLKYRTSYGQNTLVHSIEVAFLSSAIAAELGLNVKHAKRIGILHDIGKAVDHEMEGPHALVGAELAKKYGEAPKIVHAIAAHHEDEKPNSLYPIILNIADTLSAARPGAKRELLEKYIKRLTDLEQIANSFEGVSRSYALQSGREIRIIVENEKVSDDGSVMLAREICKKIEEQLSYPGQIKVSVLRETRATEIAK